MRVGFCDVSVGESDMAQVLPGAGTAVNGFPALAARAKVARRDMET